MTLSLLLSAAFANPIAAIEADCIDSACDVLRFDGSQSEGAESYSWAVDGDVIGEDEVFELELAEDDLYEIELTISGPAGEDISRRYIQTGSWTTAPEEPTAPTFPLVVAGITSCSNGNLVISTIGGCFTNSRQVDQDLERHRNGMQLRKTFSYDRMAQRVTNYGLASGAAWDDVMFNNTQYSSPVNAGNYGPRAQFPSVAPQGDEHVTTYNPTQPGDLFVLRSTFITTWDNQAQSPAAALQIDCADPARPDVKLLH
jgi:hypothetical protein